MVSVVEENMCIVYVSVYVYVYVCVYVCICMYAPICMYTCKWIMCMCIYLRPILPCSSCLSIVVAVSWTVPKLMGLRKISAASPGWAWSWSLLVRWRFQSLDQVQCSEESWVKAKRMQRCNAATHLSTLTNKLHDCQISSDIHSVYKRDWERSSPLGCRPRCLFSGTLIVAVWKLLFSACRTMAAAATSVASLLGTRFRQSHNELYTRVTPVFFPCSERTSLYSLAGSKPVLPQRPVWLQRPSQPPWP